MELHAQLVSFLTALAIGLLLGLFFDFYRVLRGVFRPRAALTFLCDGVYWLFALALTFVALLMSDWAQLRFYTFLGMLGGAALYYRALSKYTLLCIVRCLRLVFCCLRQTRRFLQSCVLRPLGYILGIFTLPLRRAGSAMGRAAARFVRPRRACPQEKAAAEEKKNH